MPSIGLGRNLIHQYGMDYNSEQRCDCCPYGYHIDLDFVPFTKKMLSREGDFKRLQELKDKWRSERQSMDKLLGVADFAPKIWDVNATISRASTDIWKSTKKAWELDSSESGFNNKNSSSSSTDLIFENGLSEAVTDFEEALLRTRPQARILSYEIPDTQKFHTFPRIKAPVLRDPVTGTSTLTASSLFSNKGSSSNTSTTVSTIIMRDSSAKASSREINKKSEDSLIGEMESIYSRSTRDVEQNNGVGDRMTSLEEQVKLIPELEVKLTLLKEEKRQLMKLLEVERQKYAAMENNFKNQDNISNNNQTKVLGKGISNGAPTVPPRRKTRDASVGKTILTRDVGISHIMPRTRSIGVGGSGDLSNWDRSIRGDSTSPTGSSCGTLRRRVKTFDTGVQVSDFDLTDATSERVPVLQIVEKVEFGVQAGPGLRESSVEKSLPRKKHAGTLAKPTTSDIGTFHRPTLRDIGSNAVESDQPKETKPRVKHIGVSAALDSESSLKERSKLKSNRAVAINTDKLRTTSVGCNTTETLKSYGSQPKLLSATKQADGSSEEVESVKVKSKSQDTGIVQSPTKSSMSLPLNILSTPRQVSSYTSFTSGDSKGQSRIPRLASPLASPVASPKPTARTFPSSSERGGFDRAESPSGIPVYSPCPSDAIPSGSSSLPSLIKKPAYQRSDTYTKDMYLPDRQAVGTLEPLEEDDREGPRSSSASSSSGFAPVSERRERVVPTKEMQGALKVLNDALLRGKTTEHVTNAISVILQEWFRVAGTKTANPFEVEDYLDSFEIYSPQLLRYIVNMPDGNGNTALHYAVSHGNFDVVSILLDSKVCDPNKANKAGYTSIMLVALAKITCEAHRQVVRRLFSSGDVNIKAAQHGQTALMLGASHGRFDTVRLLLEAGADINIQDEDGSTALMCAAEHGNVQIVKYLLAHPDCDLHLTDNDGSTAFSIAMEGGFKDIGVLLYAQMHFETSPGGGLPHRSRSTTPSSQNSSQGSPHSSPLVPKRSSDSSLFSSNK